MATFAARYPGTCGSCGERIEVGDEIVAMAADRDDDPARFAHVECDAELVRRTAPATTGVCPHCFLVLPATGRCDCRD